MLHRLLWMWVAIGFLVSCSPNPPKPIILTAPTGNLSVRFWLNQQGQPSYQLLLGAKTVIDTSALGFSFQGASPLSSQLKIVDSQSSSFDETWEMPWGEQRLVRNHYNELRVQLAETKGARRSFSLVFRLFDDGLAFRYEFPRQAVADSLIVLDEHTSFRLTGDHLCWWQPGDWDIYEHIYNETRFTEINALSKRNHPNLAQTYIPENAVNTPVTLRTNDSLYLSIHEAALYDYSDMTLKVDKQSLTFTSELVGRGSDSVKAVVALPFHTPWRTIQVATRAGDLIESKLILNLNDPPKIQDLSWIKPMKYAGIWWEMHLGMSTWAMKGGKHGATTANAKRYVDFCADNNIQALLIEGWNTGWEHWIGFDDREGVFDFVTPYPDYDLNAVVAYARQKGVSIIMHHETSSTVRTYSQQLDTAFQLCVSLGIPAVKTGYVGKIIPNTEYHHGQWMVRHYQQVVEKAAAYRIMVNTHEPIKDTGIRRTWPNFMTREGVRGQEFNAWSYEGGNPVDHLTKVAFTRMLAGPVDYTPGIMHLSLNPYKPNNQIKHTIAHELGAYVVIYSPMQMLADLPDHYRQHPAMPFLREVAVDWEQTRVIAGEPGDFVAIARQERGSNRWFLGVVADENRRTLNLPLDFLPPNQSFSLELYADAPDAHWQHKPDAMIVHRKLVSANETLSLTIAPGGGAAAILRPR